jgi:hypothetical protein
LRNRFSWQSLVFATNISAGTVVGDELEQNVSFKVIGCQMVSGNPLLDVAGPYSCTVDPFTCDLECLAMDGSIQRPGSFRDLSIKLVSPPINSSSAGESVVGLVSFTSDVTSWESTPALAITVVLVDDGPGQYPNQNVSDPMVVNLKLEPRNHEPYFVTNYNISNPIVVSFCPPLYIFIA